MGVIEIDGIDVRKFKLTALRRNIGVVFQEALLFNHSIAENLPVGKADATEAEMREAVSERRKPWNLSSASSRDLTTASANEALHYRRGAPALVHCTRAVKGSADPHPRRGDQRS